METDSTPERGTIEVALVDVLIPRFTVVPAAPPTTCEHGAPAGWQIRSTHQTSAGTIAYARCVCGAWLVLLDGQPLAHAGHPRPQPPRRSPTTGEMAARGRRWLWELTWRRRSQRMR